MVSIFSIISALRLCSLFDCIYGPKFSHCHSPRPKDTIQSIYRVTALHLSLGSSDRWTDQAFTACLSNTDLKHHASDLALFGQRQERFHNLPLLAGSYPGSRVLTHAQYDNKALVLDPGLYNNPDVLSSPAFSPMAHVGICV